LLFKIIEDKLQYKNEDEIQLKYRDIAKQAVYIIINNYTDSSLCTNQIADMMKMNTRRISRIFKDFSGVTIAEYISEVRLKKAAELLENTQISVYEIIEKIGLANESYFYKMFKARYRCTPKEYSLLKAQECREVVITKL